MNQSQSRCAGIECLPPGPRLRDENDIARLWRTDMSCEPTAFDPFRFPRMPNQVFHCDFIVLPAFFLSSHHHVAWPSRELFSLITTGDCECIHSNIRSAAIRGNSRGSVKCMLCGVCTFPYVHFFYGSLDCLKRHASPPSHRYLPASITAAGPRVYSLLHPALRDKAAVFADGSVILACVIKHAEIFSSVYLES